MIAHGNLSYSSCATNYFYYGLFSYIDEIPCSLTLFVVVRNRIQPSLSGTYFNLHFNSRKYHKQQLEFCHFFTPCTAFFFFPPILYNPRSV